MATFFVKATKIVLVKNMELKEVTPVANMNINEDSDDVVLQHN